MTSDLDIYRSAAVLIREHGTAPPWRLIYTPGELEKLRATPVSREVRRPFVTGTRASPGRRRCAA